MAVRWQDRNERARAELTTFRWPVFRTTIVASRLLGDDCPPGGVFVPEGWPHTTDIVPVGRPPTGRQGRRPVNPRGWHGYNPFALGDELLKAATRVDVDDPKSLLDFVNAWGLLGVGIWPGHHSYILLDSVALTRDALRRLQESVRWAKAIREQRWGALPPVAEVRQEIPGAPEHISRRDYAKLYSLAFWRRIAPWLRGTQPAIRWDPVYGDLQPALHMRRLLDVLYIALWDWMTQGGTRIRRCPDCGAFFPQGHARQRFCGRNCANRAAARAAYARRKRQSPTGKIRADKAPAGS